MRFKVFVLLLLSSVACVDDGNLKNRMDTTPLDTGDGWTINTPQSQGMSDTAISQAYSLFFSENKLHNAISLLVIRNGVLVAEAYSRSESYRDYPEAIQSATKSISSILTGIAMDEGYITSLDLTLYEIYPEKFSSSRYQNVSLANLLTMSSGINFDNDAFSIELINDKPKDSIKHILGKPSYATPGQEFYYRDADPHLLSYALQKLTGRTLARYAQEKLFDPLGISNVQWLQDNNGINFGAYGVFLKPRDFARIGLLMLQDGFWNASAVVSSSWVNTSTTQQIPLSSRADYARHYQYGYYWWLIPELNAYTSWGHGGNFTVVIPDKNLLVVLTAYPYSGFGPGVHLDELVPLLKILINGSA